VPDGIGPLMPGSSVSLAVNVNVSLSLFRSRSVEDVVNQTLRCYPCCPWHKTKRHQNGGSASILAASL
jgi:hypothetical protein